MKDLLNAAEMKAVDQRSIEEYGIPSLVLMERAALEARVEAIMKKIPELDEKINGVAEGWKTRRMGRVELTILRLALFEMKEDQEIPEKVAINEAVELAKKFGGDGAPAFVNGILAKLVEERSE